MSYMIVAGKLEVWAFFCNDGWEGWYLCSWQSGYEMCWHTV